MSSYINEKLKENIESKVEYFNTVSIEERPLKVVVFSDSQPTSFKAWSDFFADRVPFIFSTEYELIPIPEDYRPEQYDQFVGELNAYIKSYLADKEAIPGILDLGTEEAPKLNLVLVNRVLTRDQVVMFNEPSAGGSATESGVTADGVGSAAGREGSSNDPSPSTTGEQTCPLFTRERISNLLCDVSTMNLIKGIDEFVRRMEKLLLGRQISSGVEYLTEPALEASLPSSATPTHPSTLLTSRESPPDFSETGPLSPESGTGTSEDAPGELKSGETSSSKEDLSVDETRTPDKDEDNQ